MNNSCNICLHIRRGDFLKLADVHTNLTMDYYKESIEYMENKFKTFS